MLQELRIENLKSFRGPHRAVLAPITLIYGSNSAGKSTLIQALLLLKQTIESSDPEQPELVVRGALADLGSVPGIIHAHDLDRTLRLGITVTGSTERMAPLISGAPRRYTFSFKWDTVTAAVRQTGASLGRGVQDQLTYTRRRGPAVVKSSAALGRRQFPFRIGQKEARETFVHWITSLLLRPTVPVTMRMRGVTSEKIKATVPTLLEVAKFEAAPWTIMPLYPRLTVAEGRKKLSRREMKDRDVFEAFEMVWRQATNQFRFDLANVLDSMVYLGPLRRAPARFHLISGARRESVGREGEYLAEILTRHADILSEVNQWLERLAIPYSLEAPRIAEAGIGTTIGDVVALVLTDRRSQLQVSAGDVGFGISQLLPIIVQTQIGRNSVILIEQPEIHVHPRLQAEIANLFVSSAREHGNQMIVETHSEHIILRLQQMIRRGELDSGDVSVLYVDTARDGTSDVLRLRLGDDGAFVDEWPQGFFEERFDEIFRT